MRRFLVTAFASIATFTILANNYISVSAPELVGEIADILVSENGASAANGFVPATHSFVTPAAPVVANPKYVASGPDILLSDPLSEQPDVAQFEEHSPAAAKEQTAPVKNVKPLELVAAWIQTPSAIFEQAKLLVAPKPIVNSEILAASHGTHGNSRIEGISQNETAMATADTARIAPPAIPMFVRAIAEIPSAVFSHRRLVEVPVKPVGTEILATVSDAHETAGSNIAARERPTADADTIAMFVKAAYEMPAAIFQRARFVTDLVPAPSLDILNAASNDHTAIVANAPAVETVETMEAETTASNVTILPMFVTALAELPGAIFTSARLIPLPEQPAATEILNASSNDHVAVIVASPIAENSDSTVAETVVLMPSSLPMFVTALAELPSAIVEKLRLVTEPVSPVSPETLSIVNENHLAVNVASENNSIRETVAITPDTATIAAPQTPVLITAQTAVSKDLFKPMSVGPLPAAPLVSETAIASANDSGIGSMFDRMIATPDVPAAIAGKVPVLISGKPSFSMDMLKPLNSTGGTANPFVKLSAQEVLAAVRQDNNFCDPNWVAPPIRFSQTVELKLDDLINQLHQRFGVNFILGKGVANVPMNIKAGSIPWNVLLKSQLFISGVRARCIDANTIELVENQELPRLQDGADVETRFIKLKFLQRTTGGTVDLAGRSQGGGGQGGGGQGSCGGSSSGGQSGGISGGGGGQGGSGQSGETAGSQASSKFDKLIIEIEKILGIRSLTESSAGGSGGQGGQGSGVQQNEARRTNRFVTQIPGRNILAIRATNEEFALIDQIIVRADRAPFQVVIKGLVYSANQDRLQDIGVQTTITGGTADNRVNGGVFGHTLGTGTLFDFSAILGTFDFNVQVTALQQNGVISVKSRPFATVLDGLCTTLNVGRELPIVIDSTLGGQGDIVFVNAANNLAVTPYVVDDENGNPMAVTLELRLDANDIDSSVTTRGIPAVSRRSVQTQLLLGEDKTAILGGFTVDQDSRTVSKTPGLGNIPIIGELFKRRVRDTRINRLYFAISVSVIPFGEPIRPVDVPGATTDPPSITPEQKKRAENAEPKQVKGP